MYKFRLFTRRMLFFILLISMNLSESWTVKIVNLTDQQITVDIHSSQSYPGWDKNCASPVGCPTTKECSFIGKQIDPQSSQNFDYKDVNPICIAPCTKSVKITSPVKLSANNKLTSCSNVIVSISQNESGEWKIEYNDWTDEALKLVEERTKMPLKVRELFDKFSDSPIQSISVFRTPIQTGVNELITILTKNELKKLLYDDLFHTGFIIKCQDTLIRLERNATVSSEIVNPKDLKGLEQRSVTLPDTITYGDFITNAMENDPHFWKYHPVKRNCQLFVLQCLEKNNTEISDDVRKFIYQDAGKILVNNPALRQFARDVTSLVNRIDNIVEQAGAIVAPYVSPK